MHLVEWLQRLMTSFGAGWVMWLLIGLSVVSVAIMLERAWFYLSLRDDLADLAAKFRDALRKEDFDKAKSALEKSPSAEAAVVLAGLAEADRGAKAAAADTFRSPERGREACSRLRRYGSPPVPIPWPRRSS